LNSAKQNVKKVLHAGLHQNGEDPRIDYVSRTTKATRSDKLRSNFVCVALDDDHEQFAGGTTQTSRHTSTGAFALTRGIKDASKLGSAVTKGRKIRTAVSVYEKTGICRIGIIILLIFGSWQGLNIEGMAAFGEHCLSENKIVELMAKIAKFTPVSKVLHCQSVDERRVPNSTGRVHQSNPQKCPIADAAVTCCLSQKSKKPSCLTSAKPHIDNSEAQSIPADKEVSGLRSFQLSFAAGRTYA
jgi:hypothetical protein